MLKTAKPLKEDLEGFKTSVDNAHVEFIMSMDQGTGGAFQARTLVTKLHNKINRAVAAIWGHDAAEPVDLHPFSPEMKALALLL